MKRFVFLLMLGCADETLSTDSGVGRPDAAAGMVDAARDLQPSTDGKPVLDAGPSEHARNALDALDGVMDSSGGKDASGTILDALGDVCGRPDYPYFWHCPICGNCSLGGVWVVCGKIAPMYTECDGGVPIR